MTVFGIEIGYYFWGSVGFALGTLLVLRNLTKNGTVFPFAVIAWTIALYAGLVGARVLRVLEEDPHLFLDAPGQSLAFWNAGLAWQGGAFLGCLAMAAVFAIARKPVWSNVGCFAPGLALSHGITRVACMVEGCCSGRVTTMPWGIYSEAAHARVHPTAAYDMAGELLLALVLQVLWREPRRRKYLAPMYFVLSSAHRFVTEAFRDTPPGPELISGLRFYQTTSLVLFVLFLGVLVVLRSWKAGLPTAVILLLVAGVSFDLFRPAPGHLSGEGPGAGRCYLVVTRSMFVDTLDSWKALREEQGYRVVLRAWQDPHSEATVATWIREQASAAPAYILIVGDCAGAKDARDAWHMPAFQMPVEGSPDAFISDAPYGDLDGDGYPEVPVGRLPVQDQGQLRVQLAKIREFDTWAAGPGWLRAVVWSGVKDMNATIEAMTDRLLEEAPRWLRVVRLSAYAESPFCGDLPGQPARFLEEIANPAVLSVVVSHGSYRSITVAEHDNKEVFLSVEDVARLEGEQPLGPLVLVGCASGAFSTPADQGPCLAEAFLERHGGPIAVMSASGSTSLVTNYLAARAILNEVRHRPATIGDLFLGVQQRLRADGQRAFSDLLADDPFVAQLYDAITPEKRPLLLSPGYVSRESLQYNLLGDPASPLRMPEPTVVTVSSNAK